MFHLQSSFNPTGDQPQAIQTLAGNFGAGVSRQTLVGVTGSGKTFTMANVIDRIQKPTLVISHNKTLAAQLYQEFKEFFPENSVHYFVSYYDYYQPEAYIPQSDTYIEKDAKINELIDSLRHGATASLLTRSDVIIVASVSCIYGIGDPEEYEKVALDLKVGAALSIRELARSLVLLQYSKNAFDPRQGNFRVRENTVDIHLPSGEESLVIEFKKNTVSALALQKSGAPDASPRQVTAYKLFPAKHFVTPQSKLKLAIRNIRAELKDQLGKLKSEGKLLEAERLGQRTNFDLEMLEHTGYTNGIENYSRHLSFRPAGSPPFTLIDYYRHRFGDEFLTIIDESHVTIPQLRGMYHGDRARKETLVEYGFRLPSAVDNRPLKFDEFNAKAKKLLFASATPSPYELLKSKPHVVEQLIRPTGVLDPRLEVRPTRHQIRDVVLEIKKRTAKQERSLVMALTKRLAEDIAEYLAEAGIKAEYIHSEVKTLDRPEVLKKLREGEHEALVGINLLREGLDIPEVSFIAILDADKEGFLRNETTLLQIIGRAARHTDGTVILYADTVTESMRNAIQETERRRKIQEEYNRAHGITPESVKKEVRKSLREELTPKTDEEFFLPAGLPAGQAGPTREMIVALEREMRRAARDMNFELAARIRDRIKRYRK
ncbi:MAG: excinuclease ABC subunit UvrB [Candidatus Sungbacteria bacterium]|uniref:UvrABC system protein B n=1 Tax=Candidatus Sungiibacteriota bacterium TaxID=2750080 RepID=A0A932YYF8_9BACT|nr:excinuclease ABC subunit UvrB [Candidatus Sungbacteria bacterium]